MFEPPCRKIRVSPATSARKIISPPAVAPFSPNIWKSLPLTRLSGEGRTGVGHRGWGRQDTPALHPQTEQHPPSTPASAVPAFPLPPFGSLSRRCPAEPAQPQGGIRGARGESFLTVSVPKNTQSRLCKTRCTACADCTTGIAFNGGSESRLLMPVGRAPDVARVPSALKELFPADTPPFAHSFGHNLPVHPVLPKQLQLRGRNRGVRGELFLALQE